jgi:hypothetical protein
VESPPKRIRLSLDNSPAIAAPLLPSGEDMNITASPRILEGVREMNQVDEAEHGDKWLVAPSSREASLVAAAEQGANLTLALSSVSEVRLAMEASCLGESENLPMTSKEDLMPLSPHGENRLLVPSSQPAKNDGAPSSYGDSNLETACSEERPSGEGGTGMHDEMSRDGLGSPSRTTGTSSSTKTGVDSEEPRVEDMIVSPAKLTTHASAAPVLPSSNAQQVHDDKKHASATDGKEKQSARGRKSVAVAGGHLGGAVSVFEDLVLRQERQRAAICANEEEEEEDRDAEWTFLLHSQEKNYALFRYDYQLAI